MHNISKYSSICKATISVIPQACLPLPLALALAAVPDVLQVSCLPSALPPAIL